MVDRIDGCVGAWSRAACGGGDDSDGRPRLIARQVPTDGDLNFYNWSEYIDPDLITAFEDEYGVDVVETFYESNEAMLSQIQAGVVYDLIVPSDYMVGIMIDEGLLLPAQQGRHPQPSATSTPSSSTRRTTRPASTRWRISAARPDSA